MDVIPSDAEKIVVKENSFDNAETLSVNNYPNLTSIVFEDNVFKNVNSVEINGDKLEEVVIGDNCFSKSESGVEGSRRLKSKIAGYTAVHFLHSECEAFENW